MPLGIHNLIIFSEDFIFFYNWSCWTCHVNSYYFYMRWPTEQGSWMFSKLVKVWELYLYAIASRSQIHLQVNGKCLWILLCSFSGQHIDFPFPQKEFIKLTMLSNNWRQIWQGSDMSNITLLWTDTILGYVVSLYFYCRIHLSVITLCWPGPFFETSVTMT